MSFMNSLNMFVLVLSDSLEFHLSHSIGEQYFGVRKNCSQGTPCLGCFSCDSCFALRLVCLGALVCWLSLSGAPTSNECSAWYLVFPRLARSWFSSCCLKIKEVAEATMAKGGRTTDLFLCVRRRCSIQPLTSQARVHPAWWGRLHGGMTSRVLWVPEPGVHRAQGMCTGDR